MTLYATAESLAGFPSELFFDNDLDVHRQQFGNLGHIAFASLAASGGNNNAAAKLDQLVKEMSPQ